MHIDHIPENYRPICGLMQTEAAILLIKQVFEKTLAQRLQLTRVSAPLFVEKQTGLNDDLNGVEPPVSFRIPAKPDSTIEVVHSLAKWKRVALKRYGFTVGTGLYTDMNAIRSTERLDNLHSVYVDQWDWEKIITAEQRTPEVLQQVVRDIWASIQTVQQEVIRVFPKLTPVVAPDIIFLNTQELEDEYPDLTPQQREHTCAKQYAAVFISQIGNRLRSGQRHDNRAPDYDDWSLNGDIIVWHPTLQCALELSSMGIRVDEQSLQTQLQDLSLQKRAALEYHQMLLQKRLPHTIGGGIGQSRLCMFLLQKAHIGEVQCSIWPEDVKRTCVQRGIELL